MADTKTTVKQSSYNAFDEGSEGEIRLNRRGEIVSPDWIQQWVLDGRCFIASNTAMETVAKMGDEAYAETEPAIAIDVETGTTLVPLEIMIYQAGAVASADVTALFTLDTKVRITSGVAVTPRNLLINPTEPNASTSTVKMHIEGTTNLLTSAPARDTTFYAKLMTEDILGGPTQNPIWTAREYIAPAIKGPGSLVIYLYGTGSPEVFFHILWAEIPTANI